CSCVVKGTVRAVLYVFPMLFAMGLTFSYGGWLGLKTVQYTSGLLDTVLAHYDLLRLNRMLTVVMNPRDEIRFGFSIVVAPLLAVGLIQSLRMFRGRSLDRKLHAVRCAVPLLATLFVTSFALASFLWFGQRLQSEQLEVLRETHGAIQVLETNQSMNSTGIQRFKIEDLDR